MKETSSILKLKAASQAVRDSAILTPETALQRAVYRAAHLGLGLTLDITGAHSAPQTRDGVLDLVQPNDLLVRLEQDGDGPGVMVLDLDLISALVEVQTLGVVAKRAATARALTSTDAAVAMPLIDGALTGFEALMPRSKGAPPAGFHFGTWIRDPGLLAAQLPDGAYDTFELTLRIGTGDRVGRLALALPVPPEPEPEDQVSEVGQARLTEEILEASARLDVVLHRLEMPLGDIGALKQGDVLTFPLNTLSRVTLHGGDRKPVATAVLGQLSGQRAVCLNRLGSGQAAQPSLAEQAQTMTNVDLADPGLISAVSASQPKVENEVVDAADDILKDLGLLEASPPAGAGEVAQSDHDPRLLPTSRPAGQLDADG